MSTIALSPQSTAPARAARRGAKDAWAIADQALISGTNFLTMVLVARALGPSDFGTFTLVYSALLFANILQVALVTQPHNVLGTGRRAGEYPDYTASCGVAQLLLVLAEAAIALFAGLVARQAHWPAAGLILALVPSIVAWQLQEFIRRVLYTEGRYAAAFANDLISYGGQTLVIGALWLLDVLASRGSITAGHRWLTGESALYALAVTSAAAVGVGIWQIRGSLSRRITLAALRENWQFGKWLAGAEILTWCSSIHMYLYLAAALLGTSATGDLKAAQVLFGPTRVLAYFLDTVLPIKFAQTLSAGGEVAMHQKLRRVLARVAGPLAAYCLLVALLARPLLRLSFGAQYAGAATVLALYSGYAMLTYVQMIIAAALKAKRQTHLIFLGSVWGVVVSLAASWGLIMVFGTNGVLVAMMITAVVVTALYFFASRRGLSEAREADIPVIAREPLARQEEACPS
jgi:O-antigen/teichoic acid export membrane protein